MHRDVARSTTQNSRLVSCFCIVGIPMLEVLNMSDITRSAGVAVDPVQEAHRLFHRLWSKAYDAPGYDKREWLRFEELLRQLGLRI
jgi:hypothetical protein